jgi:hypothetical protein
VFYFALAKDISARRSRPGRMAGNNRRHIRNDGNSYNRLLMAIKVGNGAERGDKIVAVLDPRISPIRVGENR